MRPGCCGIIALAENDSTIKNITSVNSEVTGGTVGGICGYNKATVDNCTNDGIVTGKYAGGICGATSGTVMNCTNKGQVVMPDRQHRQLHMALAIEKHKDGEDHADK